MRYRTFPATGDEISVLGFGAMGFAGWFGAVDDRDSPCTPPSTWRQPDRHGTRLRAFRARRRQGARSWSGPAPFVATKIKPVGPRTQFAIPLPVDEAFPKGWVTESAETSLRELGRDHVDLMQLQLYWPTWGHEGYWMEELQALKQAGKARAGGSRCPTTATTRHSRSRRAEHCSARFLRRPSGRSRERRGLRRPIPLRHNGCTGHPWSGFSRCRSRRRGESSARSRPRVG